MDNSATTQVSEEVFEEMKPYFTEEFGNPSTLYKIGRESKKALDLARQRVADAINAKPEEIIFTSGGTESDNMAIKGIAYKLEDKGKHIITYVTYRLSKKPVFKLTYGNLSEKVELFGGATLANVRKAVCEIREAKLPNPDKIGSAGSFFMNPVVPAEIADALAKEYPSMPKYPLACGNVKLSAGWLIEQCGWKETPHEHVGVYQHQALVVINRGGATGKDVVDFAEAVVASVKEKFGVALNMEVNVIG